MTVVDMLKNEIDYIKTLLRITDLNSKEKMERTLFLIRQTTERTLKELEKENFHAENSL